MELAGFDCGCGTRKETIGTNQWWTMVTIGGAIVIVALSYGGNVTSQTRSILRIGAAGAVLAILADKFVNPKIKNG